MKAGWWIGGSFGLAVAAVPMQAQADPCASFGHGMATGPVNAPIFDGGLGRGYRVCGRTEVGLRAGGLILVDTPNFYGRVSAGGTLEGSWAPNKYAEVFAGAELVRYDTVIQSLSASAIGFGHTYVGGSYRMVQGERGTFGFNGKVVFPTASGLYKEAWPFGFDFGLVGQYAPNPRIHLRGQIGVMGSAVASHAGPGFRMGASITGGADFLIVRRFSIAADLIGVLGYTAVLDVFAGAVAFRFSNLKRFGFEVAGTIPIAGKERAQAVVMLRASVRLGSIVTPTRYVRQPRKGAAVERPVTPAAGAKPAPAPATEPVMEPSAAPATEPVEPVEPVEPAADPLR